MLKRAFISGGAALALALTMLIGEGCSKSSSTGPAGGGGGVGSVITVAGKVINRVGTAVAGVPVVVTGKPSTNTDASGNFSIPNVTTPYEIAVVDGASKSAFVYKGLTRTDPTLVFIAAAPGTSRTATVNGKISGGDFTPNQGANDVTRVVFGSPETISSTTTAASGTFGPMGLNWYGPTVTTGNLYALQVQNDPTPPNLPVTYKGYGVRSGIAVNDGSTLNNQFDTLQTIGTGQFTATVSLPAGYTFSGKSLGVRVSSTTIITVLLENTTATALTYNTPSIPGASLVLGINAVNAGALAVTYKVGMGLTATGVPISVPAAPGLSLPINGATKVDTTFTFSWTAYPGGIHVFFMQSSGNPTYYVLTSGTSTTIPNLKSLGLPLPATAAYTWQVVGLAPFASADAAAGPAGFYGIISSPVSLTADANAAQSAPWTFTTAP
jgi:hypothetical protein